MAHKVHPKIYRIEGTKDWYSKGFYGKKFTQYLEEDFKIREFLKKKLPLNVLENVEIERSGNKLNIIINTARPGLIIGRGGEGIEKLKKLLEKKLNMNIKKGELKLEIREVKDVWMSASLVAQWIASRLEKRMPFRRVLKKALDQILSKKEVKGARVQVSGRLGGIEIARTEWLKEGQLPRHTIKADIDYAQTEAICTYGKIGVKVWIYKGEKKDVSSI